MLPLKHRPGLPDHVAGAEWRDLLQEGYLDALLDALASAVAAKKLTKSLKSQQIFTVINALWCACFWVGMASANPPDKLHHFVAVAVPVVLAPVFALQDAAGKLAQYVACTLTADRIHQLATEVHQCTAATADYDRLSAGVLRAHEDTIRLSALMKVPMLANTIVCGQGALLFLAVALGPRAPNDAPGGVKFLLFPYFDLSFATICAVGGVWNLALPAQVTTACEYVASAVNDLRVTKQPDGFALLAKPDELLRIEGLKRYINELNKDKGMGFMLMGKRITRTLV